MAYGQWDQNFYQVINKEKYIGNNKPFYRSSWEHKMMTWLDLNTNVIAWSSEKVIIPYKLPKDIDGTGKIRRYFVDFYCEIKDNNGNIKKYLVEVKPKSQSVMPKPPKRVTKSYKTKVLTFMVNKYKWEAATQYCTKKGIEFKLITEEEIFNMKI